MKLATDKETLEAAFENLCSRRGNARWKLKEDGTNGEMIVVKLTTHIEPQVKKRGGCTTAKILKGLLMSIIEVDDPGMAQKDTDAANGALHYLVLMRGKHMNKNRKNFLLLCSLELIFTRKKMASS